MAKKGAKTATPRLRFPEFRNKEAWAVRSLDELADFVKGKGLPKDSIVVDGKHPCIHYGQLFLDYPEVIREVLSRTNLSESVVLSSENDVLMPTSDVTPRGLAKASCILLDDVILGGDILVIRTKKTEVDGTFLARQIRHLESKVLQLVTGSTVFHLYASGIGKLRLTMPSRLEQRKIADCLTSLDEVIAAQGRKVEALKAHKRGLMQQLFPREGETRPSLRFPEFRNAPEWKIKKLGEMAKRGSGHTPNKSHAEYYNGGIKWVSLADSSRLDAGLISETTIEISDQGIANSSAVLHPAGSVILCRDAGIGKSAVMGEAMAVSQHFIVWTCNAQILSNWFLYYLFQLMKPLFEDVASGSTIKTIGLQFFTDLKVMVPPIAEQQRIADCLSSLDTRITAETARLAALKTHKQGLMQQLFPAPEATGA